MKKLIPLVLLALLFFSCATLPKPRSEEDTIAIVPLSLIVSDDHPYTNGTVFGVYNLFIFDEYGEYVKQVKANPSNDYCIIRGLKPGTYTLKKLAFTYKANNKTGKAHPIDKKFVVKPKNLTIIDFEIITLLELSKDNLSTYMMRYMWKDIDQNQVNKIREELSTDENYHLWN